MSREEINETIIRLLKEGRTYREIMTATGLTYDALTTRVYSLRTKHVLPRLHAYVREQQPVSLPRLSIERIPLDKSGNIIWPEVAA